MTKIGLTIQKQYLSAFLEDRNQVIKAYGEQ